MLIQFISKYRLMLIVKYNKRNLKIRNYKYKGCQDKCYCQLAKRQCQTGSDAFVQKLT